MVEQGSEEESWCKERHLENNTFGDAPGEQRLFRNVQGSEGSAEGDGGASCFIEGEEVRVVVVGVREGRIADWKGGVKDWVLMPTEERDAERGRQGMVNGVV